MVLGKSGYKVRRDRIPSYFTKEAMEQISFFRTYKLLGWPYSGGWAEQPAQLVDVISVLEGELSKRHNG